MSVSISHPQSCTERSQKFHVISSVIGGKVAPHRYLLSSRGNDKEKSADQFASYFLVPSAALYAAITKCKKNSADKLSLNDIIRLEQYFGISHQAMLIRLQNESQLTSADLASMQGGIISAAARLGFDTSLYKPTEENKKMQVLGHYICQAENLLDNDIISQGKYEELLLDAFREDIVYGLESEEGDIVD